MGEELETLEGFERWPGYTLQSWSERFAELDRQYTAKMKQLTTALMTIAANQRTPAAPLKAGDLEERAREVLADTCPTGTMWAAIDGQTFVSHENALAAMLAFAAEQAPPPASDASGVEVLRKKVASILPVGDPKAPSDRVIPIYVRMDELRDLRALAGFPSHQQEGEVGRG